VKSKKLFTSVGYVITVLLLLGSSNGFSENNDIGRPVFSSLEVSLIKTLSSKNYSKKSDLSNKMSGISMAISFGKNLFFDPELSGDGTVSCATCHNPLMSWGNHQTITSLRPDNPSTRHVPSLLGVRYNRWYFWDGRADSLWSQAIKPIENTSEMAGSRVQVAQYIINTPSLKADYEALFGVIPELLLTTELPNSARPVSGDGSHVEHQAWIKLSPKIRKEINRLFTNIGKSIAAFEETLVIKNTPFDEFADNITEDEGKSRTYTGVLSNSALRGLKLFIGKAGCSNCHFGPNFSDGEFHHSFIRPVLLQGDLGRYDGIKKLLKDPFNGKSEFSDSKQPTKLDYVYQNVEFRGQFKTPSLRNIAQSYPYMHTGEFKTLKSTIEYYNTISERMSPDDHQELLLKSLSLSDPEVNDLVELLKTLSEKTIRNY